MKNENNMNMMAAISLEDAMEAIGGTTYYCPWGDYKNSSFWKTYGHAIYCGYKHGYFDIPLKMICAGEAGYFLGTGTFYY